MEAVTSVGGTATPALGIAPGHAVELERVTRRGVPRHGTGALGIADTVKFVSAGCDDAGQTDVHEKGCVAERCCLLPFPLSSAVL